MTLKRAISAFLCIALAAPAVAQTPAETAELLSLSGNLRNALRADDLVRAAALSAVLKEELRAIRNRALAGRVDEEIETILGWLPTDTETLLVAREAFTLDIASAVPQTTALRLAQGYALLPLMAGPLADLSAKLAGQTLRHAVFAARRFQNHQPAPGRPQPLGLIAWQGCGLYGVPKAFDLPALSRAPEEMLFGFEAWSFKAASGEAARPAPGLETLLVARPKPDLIAVCNDRGFLSDLLSRIGVPQTVPVFPPGSPLLKAVDRTAPLWAVRRFLPERAALDPTHPASGGMLGIADPDATGVAVEIGKRSPVRATWLSKSRANPWQALAAMPALRGSVGVQQNADALWQLTAAPDSPGLLVGFTLMGVLGFVALM